MMHNPLIQEWQTAHQFPPFEDIQEAHFRPAFECAFEEHDREIMAIVNNPDEPTFSNTIEAIEASGQLLNRIAPVFQVLVAAHTNDELQKLQSELVPRHTAHNSAIYSHKDLFCRVETIYRSKPQLTREQQQLLDETYKQMKRSGAALGEEDTRQVLELDETLSQLQTLYGQNVLKDSNDFELVLENENELDGLPQSVRDIAAKEAIDRGNPGKYTFTISRSSITPFLQFSSRRDLREKMWRAYTQNAQNENEYDNRNVAKKIASLRVRRAHLLGFKSHAEYMLDDRMAGTPQNVLQLLDRLWEPAKKKVQTEIDALQAQIQNEGGNFLLQPWDWWYYTEKERLTSLDFDSELLKPYFKLENVRQGAFDVANMLYGITFDPIDNIPTYHEDVEVFEVKESNGQLVGIFVTDYFMRPSKRSGAWMNAIRNQSRFGKKQYPIVFNTCNFPKATPALLGTEEVRTLFHEFGHALHGLLSNVTYNSLSGTSVKRDFVELPSQIMEHWAVEPTVLRRFAKHYESGEIIPDGLIEKIQQSQAFNQGFSTTEYLAASYLDMSWHELSSDNEVDVNQFETDAMNKIGLVSEIAPRYRSTYFQHIFSGGYSAGYYSYIWAEVLDADAYEEFKKNGIFDSKIATSFRENILERGGTEDPMVLYKRFKGHDPDVGPLMKSRGLVD